MIPQLYDCFKHWAATGSVYLYSDTHFGDKELQKAKVNRPTDKEQLNNLKQYCHKGDTLIHLGDVGNLEPIKGLKCYKILIMGNHDVGISNFQRKKEKKIFDKTKYSKQEALNEMKQLYPNCKYNIDEGYDFHQPFEYWIVVADNCLFDEVYSGPLFISQKILLSHEPISSMPWCINLCGHVHNPFALLENNIKCINPDYTGIWKPLNLGELIKNGVLSNIKTIHRHCIDTAIERKASKQKENN